MLPKHVGPLQDVLNVFFCFRKWKVQKTLSFIMSSLSPGYFGCPHHFIIFHEFESWNTPPVSWLGRMYYPETLQGLYHLSRERRGPSGGPEEGRLGLLYSACCHSNSVQAVKIEGGRNGRKPAPDPFVCYLLQEEEL